MALGGFCVSILRVMVVWRLLECWGRLAEPLSHQSIPVSDSIFACVVAGAESRVLWNVASGCSFAPAQGHSFGVSNHHAEQIDKFKSFG